MSKNSGTRSGLLWEVERLLNEVDELPQVLVMENVPQVHSTKNMTDFQSWLNFLEKKGYKTYWKDLNAYEYGIPQSRKRCIAVSILGNYEYEFPQTVSLSKVMKDYLEDSVDDKYYVVSDKAKTCIDKLLADGTINPTVERESIALQNLGSADENRYPNAYKTDIAVTLLSRDCKGLSNYGSNGVIECQKLNPDF